MEQSGGGIMSVLHKDEDYHHQVLIVFSCVNLARLTGRANQPSEINFWMPLSERVWGSNSLWAESAPGTFLLPSRVREGKCPTLRMRTFDRPGGLSADGTAPW